MRGRERERVGSSWRGDVATRQKGAESKDQQRLRVGLGGGTPRHTTVTRRQKKIGRVGGGSHQSMR